MDVPGRLTIEDFRSEQADELVRMWRASFEYGVGVTDPHPLAEQRDYFFSEVQPRHAVRVAMFEDCMVGFVAANQESLAQLYVRVGFHGQGIGTRLLDWAKGQSGGSLWLYTFARNRRACGFYQRHGFVAVAHGFEPMWELADVRFEWRAPERV